jgi:hypothetical protein
VGPYFSTTHGTDPNPQRTGGAVPDGLQIHFIRNGEA